jgi:hypothetical protein
MNPLLDAAALESAAEFKVQAVLNTFLRQRSNETEFIAQLVVVCRQHPEAAWQALSLLDQAHRRRALEPELYKVVKSKLNEIVFCSTGKYVAIPPQAPGEGPDLRAVVMGVVDESDAMIEPIRVRSTPVESANAISFRPLRAGALFNDRYLIVEQIASGSASTTFKALDKQRDALRETERYVAIHWLDENLQADPHAIAALQNEYAHLQSIAHPNVPKVYDIHETPGERCIVMELLPGEFLNRIAESAGSRRLPATVALTIVREIGFALANAHQRGVVHGDLQLKSVLVAHSGEVRVYGFAQADSWVRAGASRDDASRTTMPAAMRRYSSPQRRNSAYAAASDDLYSLASIAYELLCAKPLDIGALRGHWRKPDHAKHLSERQWRALRHGLADTAEERGCDVRSWLEELGMEQCRWRVPALAEIETEYARAMQPKLHRWLQHMRNA